MTSPGVLPYHMLQAATALFSKQPHKLDKAQLAQAKERAEQSLDLESHILASSEAAGLTVPEIALDKALEEVSGRFESRNEFLTDLHNNNLSEDLLRTALYRELWAESVLEKVSVSAEPATDEDVEKAYETRKAKFHRDETRQARHILITINPDYPENTLSEATKRMEEIKKRLGPSPTAKAFAGECQRHSECPSVMEGGIIGKRITPGKLYPEVDEIVFSLKKGEVGGPVESELGLHLVWLEDIFPAGPIPLEEIGPKLRDAINDARRKEIKKAWLGRLMTVMAREKKQMETAD